MQGRFAAGGGQGETDGEGEAERRKAELHVQPSGFLDCREARRVTMKSLCYLELTSAAEESD